MMNSKDSMSLVADVMTDILTDPEQAYIIQLTVNTLSHEKSIGTHKMLAILGQFVGRYMAHNVKPELLELGVAAMTGLITSAAKSHIATVRKLREEDGGTGGSGDPDPEAN